MVDHVAGTQLEGDPRQEAERQRRDRQRRRRLVVAASAGLGIGALIGAGVLVARRAGFSVKTSLVPVTAALVPTTIARLRDDDGEIECGPFVDEVARVGDSFTGLCRGDTCADSCGCACLRCGGDSGFGACYGLCRGGEGCDPLSLPPGPPWHHRFPVDIILAVAKRE